MTPSDAPASDRHRMARMLVVLAALCTVAATALPTAAVLDIDVTDATVATVESTPSSAEPGPIMHAAADGLAFTSDATNVAAAWYAEFYQVVDSLGAQTGTVQGTLHTFSDWFYGKQDTNDAYTTMNVTGVFDSDAGSYTVPALFTQSSQGTLSLRSYDAASPVKDGTPVTLYWAYDATANKYVIGTAKDLSLEVQVAPVTDTLELVYEETIQGNDYVVLSVASAGQDYVPTLVQGHHLPLLSLPLAHTWYVLMDPPLGVHQSDYDYTLQVTAISV